MKPKISIIVPVYNSEQYIHKCMDTILKQTFTDFEVILVNDGSPDNCGKICEEYTQMDKRVKVIHKENGGASSARNVGLKIAKGDYIGFVDPDDFIDKRMYGILYNEAVKHSSDIVVCDFTKVNESGMPLNRAENSKLKSDIQQLTNIQALDQMFIIEKRYDNGTGNNAKWIVLWNKLYSRHIFTELSFTEGTIYSDEMISHELLYKSEKITYIPRSLYYYVERQNSLSNFAFSIKKFDRVYALKERADLFKRKNLNELHYKALNCYMESFFWNYTFAKSTFPNAHKDLRKLKRTLNMSFLSFMKNPLISWKQKVFIFLFIINPNVFNLTKRNQMEIQSD